MSYLVDRTGNRYGRLIVLERVEDKIYDSGRKVVMWKCLCDCGNITIVQASSLQSGATKSCGCWNREQQKNPDIKHRAHGERKTRLYNIWRSMKKRCYVKTSDGYSYYGERGIEVCDEWKNSHVAFSNWAKEYGYDDSLTIDRIDVSKDYSPENCRWADAKTQQRNKTNNRIITYNGESHTLAEWSEITGVNRSTISTRIDRLGWSVEKALTTPARK